MSCEDLRRSRQSSTDDEGRAEQLEWRLSYPGTVCFEVKDHGLDYSVRLEVHPRRYKQRVEGLALTCLCGRQAEAAAHCSCDRRRAYTDDERRASTISRTTDSAGHPSRRNKRASTSQTPKFE